MCKKTRGRKKQGFQKPQALFCKDSAIFFFLQKLVKFKKKLFQIQGIFVNFRAIFENPMVKHLKNQGQNLKYSLIFAISGHCGTQESAQKNPELCSVALSNEHSSSTHLSAYVYISDLSILKTLKGFYSLNAS